MPGCAPPARLPGQCRRTDREEVGREVSRTEDSEGVWFDTVESSVDEQMDGSSLLGRIDGRAYGASQRANGAQQNRARGSDMPAAC